MKKKIIFSIFILAVFFFAQRGDTKIDKNQELKNCYLLVDGDYKYAESKVKLLVDLPRKKFVIEEFSIEKNNMPIGGVKHRLNKPYEVRIDSIKVDDDGRIVAKGDDTGEGVGVSISAEIFFTRADGTIGADAKIDEYYEEMSFSYYPQQMDVSIEKCN